MPELLRKLSEIRGLYWIRILYCYPEEITEELIDTIAELPKVCHYLDIPIQHASDKILKRMGRRTNQQQLKDKIAMIRSKIPDMCLRTTLITGFPGESQEDHEQSMAFVDEMEFDRLGVFILRKKIRRRRASRIRSRKKLKRTDRQISWSCSRRLPLKKQKV